MNSKRPTVEHIRQPTLFDLQESSGPTDRPSTERPFSLPNIFLGTSSFTAAGWVGSFYPLGMRSKDFLRHYASQFQTIEIDSTFYGTPSPSTVTSWNAKTARDFIFAVKVPQVIMHEKVLVDREPEFDEFIERMHLDAGARHPQWVYSGCSVNRTLLKYSVNPPLIGVTKRIMDSKH